MNPWNDRFRSGHHPWDIGRPSPLVTRLIDDLFDPPARVLVTGCGQGWEVEALLQRGFEVTGFDIAPAALDLIARRLGDPPGLSLQVGDLLALPASMHDRFDLVVEHNCLCSISPSQWPNCVSALAALLVPGGHLVGAFLNFASSEADGPPHGTDADTLRELFRGEFEILRLAVAREPFPPLDVPLPPTVYRVPQLEAVLKKREPRALLADRAPAGR